MSITCGLVPEPRAWPASDDGDSSVIQLLQEWSGGDSDALGRLVSLVYESLRTLATARLRNERADHALDTTALVHETYLRLADLRSARFRDRAHFLAMAACLMRRILVDYARTRNATKRGAGFGSVSLDEALHVSDEYAENILDLHRALDRLREINTRQARIIELRYFGGLALEEVADALDVSLSTVKNELRFARAWLAHQLAA